MYQFFFSSLNLRYYETINDIKAQNEMNFNKAIGGIDRGSAPIKKEPNVPRLTVSGQLIAVGLVLIKNLCVKDGQKSYSPVF